MRPAAHTAAAPDTDLGPRTVGLPGGRRLGLAEYGVRGGLPVLYCHGFPGSRFEARLTRAAAAELGLRVISTDRPGYGISDPQPGPSLRDRAADLLAVADRLELERFAVLGVSGGGPHALACAQAAPGRVAALALVGALGPLDRPDALRAMNAWERLSLRLARRTPGLLDLVYGPPTVRLLRARPDWVLRLLGARAAPADRAVLARPEVRAVLRDSLREALRQGPGGPLQDLRLYAAPWALDLAAVRCPVRIWHGEADRTVPVLHARRLAAALPGARAHLLAGEGHFSVPVLRAGEILAQLRRDAGWGPPAAAASR